MYAGCKRIGTNAMTKVGRNADMLNWMFKTVARTMCCAVAGATMFGMSVTRAAAIEPAIVEAAKKEGEVVWYTTLIVEQAVRPLSAAFEKKYPGIKVSYIRGDNSALVTRILNDSRANRPAADIVDGTAVQMALQKADLLAQWIPADQAKAYPAEYKDPNNYWVAPNAYFLTAVYNTESIKKGQQPKSFEDLLDPKLRGKIVWNEGDGSNGALSFFSNVLKVMGKEKGMAYIEKLSKQKIAVSDASSRVLADWVISGEYGIALQIFHTHAAISAAKGAPIDWIPMSPLTSLVNTTSLMKNAPHPNAGKLLFDFLLSEEGQKVFQQAGYVPTHPVVPALDSSLKPGPGRFEANVITQQQKEAEYPEMKAIYDKLFR